MMTMVVMITAPNDCLNDIQKKVEMGLAAEAVMARGCAGQKDDNGTAK